MKKLTLMRHGQAETFHPNGDFERTLTVQGYSDARVVGQCMRALPKVWLPQYVLCSSAVRACQTWETVAAELKMDLADDYSEDLLGGSVSLAIDKLMSIPDKIQSVLIVGHNPVWENLCERLTGLSPSIRPADVLFFENQSDSWVTASLSRDWLLVKHVGPTSPSSWEIKA